MTKHHIYENDLPDNFVCASSIAIDTEAMGLLHKRDRLCVVQLSNNDNSAHLVKFDGKNYSAPNLKKILSDKKILKIGHFLRFDVAILKHYLGELPVNLYCTKIASRLARTYTDRHSLKELCFELLDVRLNKAKQTSDWGSATLTKEQVSYAASDVIYLHDIKEKLDIMLKREGREALAKACFDFLPHRVELDLCGWEYDIFSHKIDC